MSSNTSTTFTSLPDPIKVAIIEDQRTIREGLAALIDGTDGFRCTGSYVSMEEALKKLGQKAEDAPDVALLDIGLPGMSGIEGIGLLRKLYPAMPVLMLTVYKDDDRIIT
jgi:DNA-binding NarL/FixJ family response regulator